MNRGVVREPGGHWAPGGSLGSYRGLLEGRIKNRMLEDEGGGSAKLSSFPEYKQRLLFWTFPLWVSRRLLAAMNNLPGKKSQGS